ncbi:Eukaryotic translation initiation factor 4B [Myotis davidii]|uniref:Eukaryotic translation initiation factor 4B n=1 Tax=Myotis davidii TaxID=225400 RepID=L5LAZ0_MYODS|nr:Eukaryotic translation initiation factor 4B [Myotis davidii]
MEGTKTSKRSQREKMAKRIDSRSAPEPKKPEESPASKFSSASKYTALSLDDEDKNKGEDYTN